MSSTKRVRLELDEESKCERIVCEHDNTPAYCGHCFELYKLDLIVSHLVPSNQSNHTNKRYRIQSDE